MMFDFEWINANLHSGLYTRTKSYFDESDYSSAGRPASAAERALLAPFPGRSGGHHGGGWRPPVHESSASRRRSVSMTRRNINKGARSTHST